MPSFTKAKQHLRAAESGNNAEIKRLLASGTDGRDCGPALVRAVRHGHEYAVERLIDAGANVRCYGDRPFLLAVRFGHIAVAETLAPKIQQ